MPRAHQQGLLSIAVKRDRDGRTVIGEMTQRFPLRTTVPMYIDPADRHFAFIYEQNPTGAIFAGDRLATSLSAGPGTRVHLTTQSATKVHAMDDGFGRQDLTFSVAAGGYLEFVPDMIIPQAGSRLRQATSVSVEPEGLFFGAETFSPGRRLSGESFAYAELDLSTTVESGGKVLAEDRMRIKGPHAEAALDGHRYLTTITVGHPGGDGSGASGLLEEAFAAGSDAQAGWLAAAGTLPNGAGTIVRALSQSAADAQAVTDKAWSIVRRCHLGLDLPGARK